MVQENYTIKREKGKHLTLVEKGKIEALLKIGISKTKIADLIGVSRRTIQREIQRGWVTGLQNTDLSTIEEWMNTYPRKLFDGKSAKEVYNEELIKNFY